METIRTRIYSTDSYSSDDVQVIFEITNLSNKDVFVLKRDTPLEGIQSDCLIVKRGKVRIPYDGVLVKRAAPQPEELVRLKPRETISSKVDVSEAYDLSKGANVNVEFDKSQLKVFPSAVPAVDNITALFSSKNLKQVAVTVKNHAASLKVKAKKRLTIGQQHRGVQKKSGNALRARARIAAAAQPIIKNGNPGDDVAIRTAHNVAYRLAVQSMAGVGNNASYIEWFGQANAARLGKVKKDYQDVKTRMETQTFSYEARNGSHCTATTFAYTTKGGDTIWLCGAFWAASPEGTDSKAGTILHEHTHASARTDDLQYGQDGYRALAKKNPAAAINNADSHEYFAGG